MSDQDHLRDGDTPPDTTPAPAEPSVPHRVTDAHGDYTRLIHGGLEPDPATGAILTPIYQTTTFVQDAVGVHKGYTYSRTGNPTVAALERNLGAAEECPPAICFATGMAAISTLFLSLLDSGDRLVVSDVVYGGVVRLLRQVLDGYGLEVEFVDTSDPAALAEAVRPATRLVLVETPANPTLKLTDLANAARVAHDAGALLAVDNTFLTHVLQRPLDLGADIAVYSTTKYVEGHNATVGGALLARDEELLERLRLVQGTLGAGQAPFEAWLTLRGLKTLPIRLRRHCENALEVAEWLDEHPGIRRVTYPGLDSFPQRELADRQQEGGGGMLTFELAGGVEAGRELMRSLKICSLAENLGAVETLVTHPASMTHASFTPEERERLGIGDGLIRLSVGLEDAGDIIADLEQALERALSAGSTAEARAEGQVRADAGAAGQGGSR